MSPKLHESIPAALAKPVMGLGQFLLAIQFLLSQAALVSLVFGLWRLGADLNLTGQFFLASGFLSHWQVWLALALAFKIASSTVIRDGSRNIARR